MKTLYPVPPDPSTDPVSLTAAAVHSLIQPLPSGTAFCIGIVLIVMMTGRLVQTKGSLARAVLPFVVHLRWGWHRVERAMERGTFSLDAMFDQAADWCLRQMPVEPVHLGTAQREVNAIDSSTIARLRANPGGARCMARCCILGALSLRWPPTWIGTSRARRGSSGCGGGICCIMRRIPPSAWMWCGLMTRPTTNRCSWAPRPVS